MTSDLQPSLRVLLPRLQFFASWHIMWGALLIPYALFVTLVVGGLDPTQDLVDQLAENFLIVPLIIAVSLPINVGLALAVEALLRGLGLWPQALISAAVFGGLWLLLAALFNLPAAFGAAFDPAAYGLWAFVGGAAYGLVAALGFEPTEPLVSPPK
jgi:hypothetical protein